MMHRMGRMAVSVIAVLLWIALVCYSGTKSAGVLIGRRNLIFHDREPARVEYRGESLPAVDMHLHTGRWKDLPRSFQQYVRGNLPRPFRFLAGPFSRVLLSPAFIARQLRDAGVIHGVLLATYAPDTVGLTTNEFVLKQVHKKKRSFHALASLPVDHWPANKQTAMNTLRNALMLPEFIGIKMAHAHMKINLDDPAYYDVYGVAAEFGVPVYVHTGLAIGVGSFQNPEATHPDFLEEAIQLYPNTTFILGHMGNDADFEGFDDPYDASFRLARTYPNVILEASALGATRKDPDGSRLLRVYAGIKEYDLLDRIVYGSDGPIFPGYIQQYMENTLMAFDRANYTVEEAGQVLFENFVSIFHMVRESLMN